MLNPLYLKGRNQASARGEQGCSKGETTDP